MRRRKAEDRIRALMAVTSRPLYGLEIADICGLRSWNLYPALFNMEANREIIHLWDDTQPNPRVIYQPWDKPHPPWTQTP